MDVSNSNRFLRIPDAGQALLKEFGKQMALARKRRKWTQKELGERACLSAATVKRLEHGFPVALDSLVQVLIALDLEETLLQVAAPEADRVGMALEARSLGWRVRKRKSDRLDTDF